MIKFVFIDISKYPNIFYFNVNHEMTILYYFFETNDFETIESKLSTININDGIQVDMDEMEENLSFSIERTNNDYIGLLLLIYTDSDIFFSIDLEKKDKEEEKEKE